MATRKSKPSIPKGIRVEVFRIEIAGAIAEMAFLPTHKERQEEVFRLRLKFLEISDILITINEQAAKYGLSGETMTNHWWAMGVIKEAEEISKLLQLYGDILTAFEEVSQSKGD